MKSWIGGWIGEEPLPKGESVARKEDKLRPYRVDYFKIDDMKEPDLAFVRSVIVRAVTSEIAIELVLHNAPADVIIIRAYRFYKKLVHKKDVYKFVEDLFPLNKAIEVMEVVEAYRQSKPAATIQPGEHVTRMSDSSLYDEVCVNCGATDGNGGNLNQPCPNSPATTATPVPQPPVLTLEQTNTGPDSPATKAVVADLQGMIGHDAHEQAMDTFAPTSVPEGKRFVEQKYYLPDPANDPLIEPDQAVGSDARPPAAPANVYGLYSPSLGMKIAIFSGALLIVLGIICFLCHR